MARGFFRKTSFWKTVGAFRSQWKRTLKRFFLWGYGKKGMGWWRDPKKAFYNWWYYRTSVSIPRLLGYKPSPGYCVFALTVACIFDLVAAPVDIAKAVNKAHKTRKKTSRKSTSKTTRTTSKKSTTKSSYKPQASSSIKTNNSTYSYKPVTEKKTVETPSSTTSTYLFPETKKVEEKHTEYVPTERIRLFEPPKVSEVKKIEAVEPDENTPKSIPKSEKDQYIRKRMTIAGSSYCDADAFDGIKIGSYFELEFEPDNPHDKEAIRLVFNGKKIGYIAKTDKLAFVTCLKLRRNIYGVITDIKDETFPTKYEFETWFDLG